MMSFLAISCVSEELISDDSETLPVSIVRDWCDECWDRSLREVESIAEQ